MQDPLVRKLEQKQAELEQIRSQLEARRLKRLQALPGELGFASIHELIAALEVAAGGRKLRSATGPSRGSKRARLTPQVREQIQAALQAGRAGAEVARAFGISYPTMHKLKTQLGLVKGRPRRKAGKR
jgi:hypothetical protein